MSAQCACGCGADASNRFVRGHNRRRPAIVRFQEKYSVNPDTGCWEWQARRNRDGYGCFAPDGTTALAHRWAWETLQGHPVPDGLELDHLCRNPPCVNPAHLEPVTGLENMRRRYALQTACKWGHQFTPENTYTGGGQRQCRKCQAAAVARYKRRHLAGIDAVAVLSGGAT